jgi:RHS repeat-associated protein
VGFGDFVSDITPDSVEHAVKKAEGWVGDRVEDAGDWTADRLEDVGLDSGADWVREQSRSVANRLGAEVDEMDLGQTEDKTKLIYGSPSKLRSTAAHLRTFQKAFDTVGDGLKGLDAAHLKGRAADAFRSSVHVQPPKWYRGADACEDAARALESFADTVTWAQGQAQDAIDAWKEGTKASKDAADEHKKKVDDYNKAVDHYNAQPADQRNPASLPPKPGEFHDPGRAKMQHAQEILSDARKQRNSAAGTVRAAIRHARDMAPPKPSYAHQVGDGFTELQYMQDHFDGGLLKGTAGLLNFARSVNPLDPYNITHPAQYLTGLDNLAAGLVKTANDPWGAGKQMLSDFLKDPSEGLGRLVPDLVLTVATDGAGAGVKAARTADEAADAAAAARRTHPGDVRPGDGDAGKAGRQAKETPCEGEPVDVATGAMLMQHTDLSLPAAGLPLVFTRTHLSSYRSGVTFGPTWICLLDECAQIDDGGVVFAAADGMRLVYPVPQPGVAVLPVNGAPWPLEWDGRPDGAMTVTDPTTGVVRTFAGPMTPSGTPGAFRLQVESWHDRNNTRITLHRTAQGLPTALHHSGGYHLAIDCTGHRVTALRLLDAPPSEYEPHRPATGGTVVVRYGYDEAGRLTEVVNSSGDPLRFTYDEQDRVTSWADRNNTSFRYIYDQQGRVERTEGSCGVLSGSFTYDDQTRTTTYTDSLGHRTAYHFTPDGQVVRETDQLGNTTLTERDQRGRPVTVTDPLGHTTGHTYDADGNLTALTLPDGVTAHARYNAFGRPVEVTEPGGAVWRHTYDDRGNRLTTTDPLGAGTHYTYNDRGHLIAVTDALGRTRRFTVNAAGLPTAVTDELGNTTTIRHNGFGRITEVTDPLGHTTRMGWTIEGKPAWREHPDGSRETWQWDAEGNLTAHCDPAGRLTRQTATHFNLPATHTDPDGGTYAFAYDTELRLTAVTNPQGLTWTYTYDPAGRLTAETDFNGHTLRYRHDAAGRLVSRMNAEGQTLHYVRDARGRVTQQRTDDGEITSYGYGPTGQVTRAANADAVIDIERDLCGRTTAKTVAGRTISYTYDHLGRRVRRLTPSGMGSDLRFDAAGRLVELSSQAGTLSFSYDAAGRETRRGIGPDVTLNHHWDVRDRLVGQSISSAARDANRLLQHRTFTYRADGYLTEIRDLTAGTRTYDLDAMGRVTDVHAFGWRETYAYDSTGNLTLAEAPAHRSPGPREFRGLLLRRAGRTTYAHDAQGRLIRKTRKLLNGRRKTWTYTWNAEDRLTGITTPEGDNWRYRYDPMGRRISKQRLGDGNAVVDRVDFVWDDNRIAEQWTSDGTVTVWEYEPGSHRALAQIEHRPLTRTPADSGSLLTELTELADAATADHSTRFHAVVTDAVGTPTELVTPGAAVAWERRSTHWGTDLPTAPDDAAAVCPLRFPGQYADPESGLHYNRFRYYDPEAARYLSPDPLGLSPARNPIAYVPNTHVWSDPLGLEGCKIGEPDPASQQGDLGTLADRIAAHGDINNRGIPGVDDLDVPEHLENVMRNSHGVKLRSTPSGTPRWIWWDDETGTVIIREGNNGTFFQPDTGYEYYLKQLRE